MCLIYGVKKVVFGIPIYRFLLPASFLLPFSGYPSQPNPVILFTKIRSYTALPSFGRFCFVHVLNFRTHFITHIIFISFQIFQISSSILHCYYTTQFYSLKISIQFYGVLLFFSLRVYFYHPVKQCTAYIQLYDVLLISGFSVYCQYPVSPCTANIQFLSVLLIYSFSVYC